MTAGSIAAIALVLSGSAAAAEVDCIMLVDGTALRGVVRSWGDPILFSPRGTDPEIALDLKYVRSVQRGDGTQCIDAVGQSESPIAARALGKPAERNPVAEERPAEAVAPNPNVELPASMGGSLPAEAVQATEPLRPPQRWYGAPILVADGGVLALVALAGVAGWKGANVGAGVLTVAAGGLYLLGSPIVHALHDRAGHAVGMFFLRLGLPAAGGLIGGLIGLAATPDTKENAKFYGGVAGVWVGLGIGVLSAIIADNVTAFEPIPPPPARVSVAPIATPATRTRGLALSLKF